MPDPTPQFSERPNMAFYGSLLGDIKTRIRQAQTKAIFAANAEMIGMYWDIGRMICERQQMAGWGAGVIPLLALDLKNELPEMKGFSERNIKLMAQFFREYPSFSAIGQRAVAQLGSTNSETEIGLLPVANLCWAHNVLLMQKIKDLPTRNWYMLQTLQNGWSRDVLGLMIKSNLHERQGESTHNFATTLPNPLSDLAQQALKDPYIFDFLTLAEPFSERELETELIKHLEKFLLELGAGFAFVGRQYHVSVSDKDFYADLLFYHLKLRCFVVIDLKKGDFKPEYAGKMNFYCSVMDDLMKHPTDQSTIGLILCQTKDKILAEYALRDMNKPIGVSEYELTRALPEHLKSSLPSIEALEAELARNGDKNTDNK